MCDCHSSLKFSVYCRFVCGFLLKIIAMMIKIVSAVALSVAISVVILISLFTLFSFYILGAEGSSVAVLFFSIQK